MAAAVADKVGAAGAHTATAYSGKNGTLVLPLPGMVEMPIQPVLYLNREFRSPAETEPSLIWQLYLQVTRQLPLPLWEV